MIGVVLFVILGIAGLAAVYLQSTSGASISVEQASGADSGEGSPRKVRRYPFVVGQPGPGDRAPQIRLPSTAGPAFDLAAQRGRTVLLYFQEGLMCQPCWDQLKDIEERWDPSGD